MPNIYLEVFWILDDWLINRLKCCFFFGIKGHVAQEIRDRDSVRYSCDLSQDIFKGHVPIDSSTHYITMRPFRQSGITVKLQPQRMRAKQGGVFTNSMMVFGIAVV